MTMITRRFEFDAAHRVTQHGGKCRNLHGHRYVVELTVSGEVPEDGMIVDFGILKRIVGGWIDEHLDHGMLVKAGDAFTVPSADGPVKVGVADVLRASGWKCYVLEAEPTAENLVEHIKGICARLLAEHSIKVERVRLAETPNAWASTC